LLPGRPGTFEASCIVPWPDVLPVAVPAFDGDLAAGPLLPPGIPGTPAPEFGVVGVGVVGVTVAPPDCPLVCAVTGNAVSASATAAAMSLSMGTSQERCFCNDGEQPRAIMPCRFNGAAALFVPAHSDGRITPDDKPR
jgi:hypothetical protein